MIIAYNDIGTNINLYTDKNLIILQIVYTSRT